MRSKTYAGAALELESEKRRRLETRLRLANEALVGPLGYWERHEALEIRDRLEHELAALGR
jgi:hypothetical protein